MRLLLPLLLVLLIVVPAEAGDERRVELPLESGKSLEGVIKSATGREVVLELGPNRIRRVPWDQLAPLGVYRAKAALSPPADGEARKKLAELAADLGLYAEARLEYEKAHALGALKQKEFDHLVKAAEMHAVKAGVAMARHQAEAGNLEGALETATQLRMHFASAPNSQDINRLVDDLVKLVQRLDKESAKDQAELEKALVDVNKNKEILRRKTQALGQVQKGTKASEEATKARKKGNLTWGPQARGEGPRELPEGASQPGTPAPHPATRQRSAAGHPRAPGGARQGAVQAALRHGLLLLARARVQARRDLGGTRLLH